MEFNTALFSTWGAGLCLLGAALWLFRLKTQPIRTYIMTPAFLTLALLFYGFGNNWATPALFGIGVILFIFLSIDMATRSAAKQQATRKESAHPGDQS